MVVREDSIKFFTLRVVPTQGQGFVLVDKDCECIVSTQSVRIALIFHNGFCRVRFPIMEQVFFHVSSPALLRNATGGGFCQEENATNTRFLKKIL